MVEERRQNHIDPVEFGRLIGSVESLTKAVTDLTVDVIDLKSRLNTGRGMAMGVFGAAAMLGGTAGAFAHKLLENIK